MEEIISALFERRVVALIEHEIACAVVAPATRGEEHATKAKKLELTCDPPDLSLPSAGLY